MLVCVCFACKLVVYNVLFSPCADDCLGIMTIYHRTDVQDLLARWAPCWFCHRLQHSHSPYLLYFTPNNRLCKQVWWESGSMLNI